MPPGITSLPGCVDDFVGFHLEFRADDGNTFIFDQNVGFVVVNRSDDASVFDEGFHSYVKIPFAFATGVIDVHNFQFSIEIQCRGPLFAIADSCSFNSAKGNVRFTSGGR